VNTRIVIAGRRNTPDAVEADESGIQRFRIIKVALVYISPVSGQVFRFLQIADTERQLLTDQYCLQKSLYHFFIELSSYSRYR
jgi:hypothetical protein